jgi:hypothetical protein
VFNVILVKEERPPLQKSVAWLIEPTDRTRPPTKTLAAKTLNERVAELCWGRSEVSVEEALQKSGWKLGANLQIDPGRG